MGKKKLEYWKNLNNKRTPEGITILNFKVYCTGKVMKIECYLHKTDMFINETELKAQK